MSIMGGRKIMMLLKNKVRYIKWTNHECDTDGWKGVNFNGTIVIARYGGIFRGLKVWKLVYDKLRIFFTLNLP